MTTTNSTKSAVADFFDMLRGNWRFTREFNHESDPADMLTGFCGRAQFVDATVLAPRLICTEQRTMIEAGQPTTTDHRKLTYTLGHAMSSDEPVIGRNCRSQDEICVMVPKPAGSQGFLVLAFADSNLITGIERIPGSPHYQNQVTVYWDPSRRDGFLMNHQITTAQHRNNYAVRFVREGDAYGKNDL